MNKCRSRSVVSLFFFAKSFRKSKFFRQRDRSLGQFGPRKNSYFSAVSLRFFRGGFTTCAEPPRAPHLPALQNSPFADLLACVDLSPWCCPAACRRVLPCQAEGGLIFASQSEVRKSEVRKWSMLSKVLNRDRRSFFLCVSLSFCLLSF